MPLSMGTWAPMVVRNASPAMTDTRRPTFAAHGQQGLNAVFLDQVEKYFLRAPDDVRPDALPRGVLQHGVRVAPSGADHRVENDGPDPLIIIEIQLGLCLEDDIVRLEDDFGRA